MKPGSVLMKTNQTVSILEFLVVTHLGSDPILHTAQRCDGIDSAANLVDLDLLPERQSILDRGNVVEVSRVGDA